MDANKALARAGYLVAAQLFAVPLVDAAMQASPFQPGDPRWRLQTIGSLSSGTLVPLLGLLIIVVLAAYAREQRAIRFVGYLCTGLAVVIAAMAVLFVLDYSRLAATVPPQLQHVMAIAMVAALVKFILVIAMLALLALASRAIRNGMPEKHSAAPRRRQPTL
jgi:chromate transport protein ChrA